MASPSKPQNHPQTRNNNPQRKLPAKTLQKAVARDDLHLEMRSNDKFDKTRSYKSHRTLQLPLNTIETHLHLDGKHFRHRLRNKTQSRPKNH